MRILLVQCPCSFGVEMPSLGLAYLSSYLKRNKHNVSILDLSVDLYESVAEENKKYWKSNFGYCWYLTDIFRKLEFLTDRLYDECVNRILSLESDIVGFSIQNTSVLFTYEVIKRIKEKNPSKKIILGGPNCYNVSGENSNFKLHHDLQKFADIIVVGEGEKALLEIVRRTESGVSLNGCKGVAIPKDKVWFFNGYSEPFINLDELPFPDFDAYNLKLYTDKNSFPILSSRGCVMKCVFCTDTHFWSPYRYRSAENVVTEIELVKQKYGNSFFSFNDSLINGNHRNLLEMCNLINRKKLDIFWGGNCRVDKRLDLDFMKKMKNNGCRYFILGIESASNKVLKLMRKGFTIEEVEFFLSNCAQAGIDVIANWVVGFPQETNEDFMETANFIIKNRNLIKRNTFSTLTINQFSYLEKHKEEFGIVLEGQHLGLWRSSDGVNNIEQRLFRLRYLEDLESRANKDYSIVRQVEI